MSPTLDDGALVLAEPLRARRPPPVVGDVVVARHPFRPGSVLIKRVGEIVEGRYRLVGDNPSESTDSRSLGCFGRQALLAKVVVRI